MISRCLNFRWLSFFGPILPGTVGGPIGGHLCRRQMEREGSAPVPGDEDFKRFLEQQVKSGEKEKGERKMKHRISGVKPFGSCPSSWGMLSCPGGLRKQPADAVKLESLIPDGEG